MLSRHLSASDATIATSALAEVEVSRAATIASPGPAPAEDVARLFSACLMVSVSASVLATARSLAGPAVRTLDAIHLASALRVEPDELVAYDHRLLAAARTAGMAAVSPGA